MKEPNLGDIKDWSMADDIEQPKDYPIEPEFIVHKGEIVENDPYYGYDTQDITVRAQMIIWGLIAITSGLVAWLLS